MGRQNNSQPACAEQESNHSQPPLPNHHQHRPGPVLALSPVDSRQPSCVQQHASSSLVDSSVEPQRGGVYVPHNSNQVSMKTNSSESSDPDGFTYEMAKQLAIASSNSESSADQQNKDDLYVSAPTKNYLQGADSFCLDASNIKQQPEKAVATKPISMPKHALHHQAQRESITKFQLMVQKYAQKLLAVNQNLTGQEAATHAYRIVVSKLKLSNDDQQAHSSSIVGHAAGVDQQFCPHDSRVVSELIQIGAGSGIKLNEEAAQTVLEVRNQIEKLTATRATQNQILHFKDSNEQQHHAGYCSGQLPKSNKLSLKGQYQLSKAYYEKQGKYKISSSSSSAGGGSGGGHSSDDQQQPLTAMNQEEWQSQDSITLLKKRNFRDFRKQCSIQQAAEGSQTGDLCDDFKLFKFLEHERKKKAKFSHAGLLVGATAGVDLHHRGAFYTQRAAVSSSLKRKRKDVVFTSGSEQFKQRIHRRKDTDSSSD